MSKHTVVIVGGGFGGVKAALSLAKDRRFHITLISDHPDFRYYPTLFRTATGGRRTISSIPLTEIFTGTNVHIVEDSVAAIDKLKRTVTIKTGDTFDYDAVILAFGVQTNYFHIKGLEEFSYGIKNLAAAEALKHHLHQQFIDEHQPDLNYVVVGGGPTGIELAGALPSYLRKLQRQHQALKKTIHIDLIEAAPRLLPRLPKDLSRRISRQLRNQGVRLYVGSAVQAETADSLIVNNKPIRSHTVVWTAGVTNHPFFAQHDFQLSPNHKVRVDQYLQNEPGIYVIGDNADTPYSGMAQTALHDGGFVADNLKRLANKKDPKPYVAKKPIYVFPAGDRWAAVLWGNVRIYGYSGFILRRLADLIAYHDYEPWKLASKRWIADNDSEDDCPICGSVANKS
ncbi:MAG: NAD(P)/FAD-dependent oxidoreductase [Candidatus Saccharimonadales bacterium]